MSEFCLLLWNISSNRGKHDIDDQIVHFSSAGILLHPLCTPYLVYHMWLVFDKFVKFATLRNCHNLDYNFQL